MQSQEESDQIGIENSEEEEDEQEDTRYNKRR